MLIVDYSNFQNIFLLLNNFRCDLNNSIDTFRHLSTVGVIIIPKLFLNYSFLPLKILESPLLTTWDTGFNTMSSLSTVGVLIVFLVHSNDQLLKRPLDQRRSRKS